MTIPVGRPAEIAEKLARVRTLLDRLGLKGILLRRAVNVAWLTGGRHTHVTYSDNLSVASALVTAEKLYLLTNRIDAPRLTEEENLAADGFAMIISQWSEGELLVTDIAGGPVGVDSPHPHGANVASALAPLRYSLTADEIERYRWLGQTTAAALQSVARSLTPGLTEEQVAGRLTGTLVGEGLFPQCILVGTDERIFRYRRPLPTNKRLDRYAMLVVGARRWGLHVSCTRLVYFGVLPPDLRRTVEWTARIDATYITNTRPGARIADIFRKAQDMYSVAGYPNEWQLHHQGGACGYEGRDYLGTPNSSEIVVHNQAFAWNPSIAGAKSEDTILTTNDDIEILSSADNWPLLTFVLNNRACRRPVVLEMK